MTQSMPALPKKQALIEQCAQRAQERRAQLQAVTEETQRILSSNEEFSKRSSELNSRLASLTMQLSDYRVKLTQAQSSMEEIESRKDEADAAALELQEEIKAEQENQAQSARTLAALNSRIEENTNALNGFNLKLKGKTDKAQQLKTG